MRDLLRSQGFVVLRDGVEAGRIARLNQAIDDDLATGYDPARQAEYDARSACPDLRSSAVVADLLADPGLDAALREVLPLDSVRWDDGQIAVRWCAHGAPAVPVDPHIDGIATANNGVIGPLLHTFTALVGVFATPSHGPDSGNFTVWPDSTRRMADWFAKRGRRALLEGMPPVELGTPVQLEVQPGDVVIANYLLAHGCSRNVSSHQRRAVFFRGRKRGLALHRYASLTNPWKDWL